MSNPLGIIAGAGELPKLLAEHCWAEGNAAFIVDFHNDPVKWDKQGQKFTANFEKPEAIFKALNEAGCSKVVMAGAMKRPTLDPEKFDQTFAALAPSLMAALSQGDDAILRMIVQMFEDAGFEVVAPQDVIQSLVLKAGCETIAQPTDYDKTDAARAEVILKQTADLDVGQAVVVAGGLCLGIETLQGTEQLLEFVGRTDPAIRPSRGLLMKAPKLSQELRADMPAIGPDTMDQLVTARLSGVVIPAGSVLLINRDEIFRRADANGLFIWSKE